MKKFWTSDTHFNQERTFKYSMRSMYFKNLDEMNREMILRWNKVVSENDTVYHLGDFGDYDYLRHLNGNIILLEGNYERDGISKPTPKQAEKLSDYITNLHLYDHENKMLLVHEPSHIGDYHGFYLFGHIHEKQKVKKRYVSNGEFARRDVCGLNVGVDCHNFTPVSLETVEFYRNAIENVYDEECFNQF